MPLRKKGILRVPVPIAAGFAILAAMVLASFLLTVFLSRPTSEMSRVSDYRRTVTDVLNAARDAETGQRGFLLTGDEKYLEPFNAAKAQVQPSVSRVRHLLDDRGRTVADEVQPVIAAKLADVESSIALQRTGQHAAAIAVVESGKGKQLMDRLRVIGERERIWAIDRTDTLLRESTLALRLLVVGLAAGAIAIIVLSLLWLKQARAQLNSLDIARADAETTLVAFKAESDAREDAEGRLRQLQKMESLGQLTGGIAHDFNNMLAVVLGGIELAKKRLRSDPDRADGLLENAREGAMRAATLTSRLLAFSRNQPLAPTPLDVNKLVGGMCEMLDRTLGDHVAVECVYSAGLWRCYADPNEVENVILNLAVNARDAMPSGGKLTVETANAHIDDNYARTRPEVVAGQYVMICVTDTGTGMSQEVIERAFDPFYTTKAVGKGTGLGLSQVFGFAKQSGGHVAIYSETGQGTTVKVYLPRYTGNEAGLPAATGSTTDIPEGKASEIILVVEDEQRVRHFAVDALRDLGYTAISAATPVEALHALAEQPEITLLFTDIVMPEMTGRQLADEALKLRPKLPILFTTGYTRNAVVHNGMLDIGVAFLPKPYTIADLARKVRDVLDGGGVNRTV